MSAGIHNIEVEQGATFRSHLTWLINSNEVDLTDYSARLKVRKSLRTTPIVSLTSAAEGGITLGGVDGSIDITMSATQTAALNPGKYSYDLELESSGGEVTRLLKGSFTVSAEVTY